MQVRVLAPSCPSFKAHGNLSRYLSIKRYTVTGFMVRSASFLLLELSLGRNRGPEVMPAFSMYSAIAEAAA